MFGFTTHYDTIHLCSHFNLALNQNHIHKALFTETNQKVISKSLNTYFIIIGRNFSKVSQNTINWKMAIRVRK